MPGMRRTVSVCDVGTARPAPTAVKLERRVTAPPREFAEVDCGAVTVSFKHGHLANYGLASLVVRIDTGSRIILPSSMRRSMESACAALDEVLGLGLDFVVTCDLRGADASGHLARGLAKFCERRREGLARLAKSAAVLVQENLFRAVSDGLVGTLGEALFPVCPFLVCHGEAAAEEFFLLKANGTEEIIRRSPYVSMVGVSNMNHEDPEHHKACVASLAPIAAAEGKPTRAGATDTSPAAAEVPHTCHVLPNGDVRVIQCAPRDIVLGVSAKRRRSSKAESIREEASANASPEHNESGAALAVGEPQAMAALRFKGTLEHLQRLVGIHFHVGELVVDAEAEATAAASPSGAVFSRRCFLRGAADDDQGCPCGAGIASVLRRFAPRARVR